MPGGPGRRPPPYHPGGPGGPGGPLPPDHPDHPGAPDHPGPPPFPDAESGPERARPDSRSDRDADYHGRQPPRGRPDDDVTPRCMSFEAWQRDRRGPL